METLEAEAGAESPVQTDQVQTDRVLQRWETRGGKWAIELYQARQVLSAHTGLPLPVCYGTHSYKGGDLIGSGCGFTRGQAEAKIAQTIEWSAGTGPGSQNYREVTL